MESVFKYPVANLGRISRTHLTRRHEVTLSIYSNAVLLSVGIRDSVLYVYAEINDQDPVEDKHFAVYQTGQKVEDDSRYFVGTASHGRKAFHVFEIFPPPDVTEEPVEVEPEEPPKEGSENAG